MATIALAEAASFPLQFGQNNTCAGIVSVTTPSPSGNNATSTITANGSGGTCSVTYYDGSNVDTINIDGAQQYDRNDRRAGNRRSRIFGQGAARHCYYQCRRHVYGEHSDGYRPSDYIAMDDAGDVFVSIESARQSFFSGDSSQNTRRAVPAIRNRMRCRVPSTR